MHITLILDDQLGQGNPNPNTWVNWHGITYPVMADPAYAVAGNYTPSGSFGIPCYTVLDRELRIVDHASQGFLDDSLINQLLAEPVPPVSWPMP
ncbi:MAG: hypothetical protein KDA24_23245 [Deltaproteobacteria bacterium]|nr:hypothetical protein [Deltaproteobacteria bacterium]